MSGKFLREFEAVPADELVSMLRGGGGQIDSYLGNEIYMTSDRQYLDAQRERLLQTVENHRDRLGNVPTVLMRAPGRLNAFLEYLDMCDGDHMSTTIDGDIPLAFSMRNDDTLNLCNVNLLFPSREFSVSKEFLRFADAPWSSHAVKGMKDDWDSRSLLFPHYGHNQGEWTNYVLSPYMRMMWENPRLTIRGADMTFGPATTPFRAGVSSSSAMVVLSFLAMYFVNRDILPEWTDSEVCRFLGQAEWYVGTHGGANDQMTILFNPTNSVSYNRHSQKEPGVTALPFLKGVNVVLANSLWEVNKSAGGNQSFNMRKGWMELGDKLARKIIDEALAVIGEGKNKSPGWLALLVEKVTGFTPGSATPHLENDTLLWETISRNYNKFGSLHEDILGVPNEAIEEFIYLMPVKIRPVEAAETFGTSAAAIERHYTSPKREIGGYHVRTTARFFYRQNVIGRRLERIFLEAERRVASGELSTDSEEYDSYRREVGGLVDNLQDALTFDFRVSIPQLDLLLSIAKRGPGYLGGKLTGAGKGGCVSILVREKDSQAMCEYLDREYYGKPERFEYYLMVLNDEMRFSEPGEWEYESARERLDNLNKALASVKNQRRVVTFSHGACALKFP